MMIIPTEKITGNTGKYIRGLSKNSKWDQVKAKLQEQYPWPTKGNEWRYIE